MTRIIEFIIEKNIGRDIHERIYYKSVYQLLYRILCNISARTFIMELNYLKPFLHGETEEEKFEDFCRKIDKEYLQNELQRVYPVLFQILENKVQMISDYVKEIEEHFRTDQEMINRVFYHDNRSTNIIDIDFGKGDSHHNGRLVAILTLDNQKKLVYKPRSMRIDIKYQALVQWFAGKMGIKYCWYQSVDCYNYGWCEYVEKADCHTKEEAAQYYYRNGLLIFISYLLGSSDLHYENLIAHGEFPVIIDLETVLSGGDPVSEKKAEGIAGIIQKSVLQSGLLPLYAWGKDGKGVNISALNGTAGQILPMELPTIVNSGTSEMRIEYKDAVTKSAQNLCMLNGDFCDPFKYHDKILKGFSDAYYVAMNNPKELKTLLLQFSHVPIRKLLRDTQCYSMILSLSWHPKYLTQVGEREKLFFKLDKELPDANSFEAWKLQQESKILLQGDIPYFWFDPSETDLVSDLGSRYPGFFKTPVIETLCKQLNTLSVSDLNIQERFIRSSLAVCDATKQKRSSFVSVEDTKEDRFYAAERIGRKILDNYVIAENGEIGWIQSIYAGYQEQGILTRATDAYLYSGTSGILLYLIKLNTNRRDQEYQQMIHKLSCQLTEIISCEYPLNRKKIQTGIYTGESSLAFICQLLFLQTGDELWLQLMERQLLKMIPLIKMDNDYDLLSGNAGAVMAYLNAYEITGNRQYLSIAIQAGDQLVCKAIRLSYGWCWYGEVLKKGATGMAHGNSGIMLALSRLGYLSHQSKFYDAAYHALCYEDFFFSVKKNDWMDLRFVDQLDLINEIRKKYQHQDIYDVTRESPGWMNIDNPAWCHGRAGIELSRKCALKYADERLHKELIHKHNPMVKSRSTANVFNLCHGSAGIAAINQIINGFSSSGIEEMLSALCNKSVANFEDIFSLQERQNYGLISGMAGVGYSLLSSSAEMQTLLTGDISFVLKRISDKGQKPTYFAESLTF